MVPHSSQRQLNSNHRVSHIHTRRHTHTHTRSYTHPVIHTPGHTHTHTHTRARARGRARVIRETFALVFDFLRIRVNRQTRHTTRGCWGRWRTRECQIVRLNSGECISATLAVEHVLIAFTGRCVVMSLRYRATSGTYNVRATEMARDKTSGVKTLRCIVHFLDDTETAFDIDVSLTAVFS